MSSSMLKCLCLPAAGRLVAGRWWVCCLLALGPAVALWAEAVAEGEGDGTLAVAAPAPAGLRAYIDPETGELTSTPSPEQVEALSKDFAPGLNTSSEGLVPFALRSGGRGVFLQGRFLSALKVRSTGEGGFELSCTSDLGHSPPVEAAAETHHHRPAAQPHWVER